MRRPIVFSSILASTVLMILVVPVVIIAAKGALSLPRENGLGMLVFAVAVLTAIGLLGWFGTAWLKGGREEPPDA